MTLVYVYVALAAYNLEMLTLPMASVETIVDGAASVAGVERMMALKRGVGGEREEDGRRGGAGARSRRKKGERNRERESDRVGIGEGTDWTRVWDEGTDAVMDVPLAGVCEVLYGRGTDGDGAA